MSQTLIPALSQMIESSFANAIWLSREAFSTSLTISAVLALVECNSPTTKYKQATASSGLSGASLVTPGVGSGNAQSLTLSGGNQVFLQFQVTTGELQATNKTYTITNGSDTATISVTEAIR